MVKAHLYEPFEIALSEPMDECPRPIHSHSFFELIYIVSGKGRHFVNESSFHYSPGHLFLITPGDSHHFDIQKQTTLLFVRFNESYIGSSKLQERSRQGIAYILKNANHDSESLLNSKGDQIVAKSIMEAIIREHSERDFYHQELLLQFIDTILMLIVRNITTRLPEKVNENTDEKALEILQYVQANIAAPEKIRAKVISKQFGISENYLGRYFKKQTNETLQEYIIRYKLRMAESRLLHSNMRLNEIADSLGFTDKSHLNRLFKKYNGVSPAQYRKQQQI
ncbi:helix-turn-helix domain-containing protein [Chitinophaga ginsengisoli]|uniref:AraC family transcriptional regulator n=1 Tax=Chitinophaga ginsengisoli TaxID=363837 RepID=A0A2P8GE78_9BACT|nr:AraC family transcriptional regulator [Chitinophaga ginsengisoli]PSL32250.1 AraC family transcriptional regulator [Chitinophaga ginsengisoli]